MQDTLEGRLEFLGLDEASRDHRDRVRPVIEAHLGAAFEAFHSRSSQIPSSVRFLFGKDQLETGTRRQADQFGAVLTCAADAETAEASKRLGQRHARLKLEPRWHIGGYGVMVETVIRGVVRDVLAEALKPRKNRLGLAVQRDPEAILGDADQMAQGIAAMVKSVLLDIDLVTSSHIKRVTEESRASEERVRNRMRQAAEATGQTLRLVAGGKLDQRFTEAVEPEFEQVRESANAVADRLAQVLLQLRSTSHSLRSATGEIQSSTGDLSGRTLQQAVAIEQANDMIRQLATTLAENAKRLSSAGKMTKSLVQGASASGEAMREAGAALSGVIDGNTELAGLSALFEDMAFQSNLLALKASVEAANAGKSGTGFGEVAIEMRALAQRAAEASQGAKKLIDTGSDKVKEGLALVTRAVDVLGTITGNAADSAQTVEQVAKAGRSQCDALEQVILVLREMNETIQHNAVLGEQTNAALEQTSLQIEALDVVMRLFETRPEAELAMAQAG